MIGKFKLKVGGGEGYVGWGDRRVSTQRQYWERGMGEGGIEGLQRQFWERGLGEETVR